MNLAELPLHRKLAFGAGAALFILYLFPWFSLRGFGIAVSANAWNSTWGVLGGIVLIALLAWEGLRLTGNEPNLNIASDLVTAGLAALATLFTVILFFQAIDALGFGAILGLIVALGLGYAAFLSFTAAGGAAALPKSGGADAAAPPPASPQPPAQQQPPPAQQQPPPAQQQPPPAQQQPPPAQQQPPPAQHQPPQGDQFPPTNQPPPTA